VSSLAISFPGLSLAKLYQQWRSPADVGMKKIILDFPAKEICAAKL